MKVELIPAFCWDCPECGRENLQRSIMIQLSDEEINELVEEGIPDEELHVQFMTSPKNVICKHCKEKFETVEYDEEPCDDPEE